MSTEATISADIEITPEMLKAGIVAFKANSIDGDVGRSPYSWEELVTDVFNAMYAASPLAPQAQNPAPPEPGL